MKLFVSPHNDDEALFGALTLLREKPLVVVVFDSYIQQNRGNRVTWEQRRDETRAACGILGCEVRYLGFRDDDLTVTAGSIAHWIEALGPSEVWAPAYEPGGHHQHNLVARACDKLPGLTRYLTYTVVGKSKGREVPVLEPSWIGKKLQALACYESQWDPRLGCWPHFLREQMEYYA